MFPDVKSVDEITDERIISAQHQVIKQLADDKYNMLGKLQELQDLNQQFYRQCLAVNVLVMRDPSNKIKLQRM